MVKMRSPIHKKPDRPSIQKCDRGAPETGFLRQFFVTTHRFGQKPGFFAGRRGPRNRVFMTIFRYSDRFGQKPGFLDRG
ncbi:hypothetical protein CP500_011485 [Tychonema bourrellyi FEM_GT703]|uniref:Uncharacterized protein n=1 Tax=Tychonema bourrellyi FEM_GT703 TaxID=2040638 RepID=A0A2G4F0M6_9CYAN|nr:hypothetical protein CP500_011485 [Tychonema bourrellyi FEM_GT703]